MIGIPFNLGTLQGPFSPTGSPSYRSGTSYNSDAYRILIKTDNAGTSNDNQFTFPGSGTYDVDWGDGSTSTGATGTTTKTYDVAGTYVIQVSGGLNSVAFSAGGDRRKLLQIQNWGAIAWNSLVGAYYGCENLTSIKDSSHNFSGVTSASAAFRGCSGLTTFPILNLSNVTNFGFTWRDCTGLTSFPLINTSSGTAFNFTWEGCTNLTTLAAGQGTNMGAMTNGTSCFTGTPLSPESYSRLLVEIEAANSNNTVTFAGGGGIYNPMAASVARADLIADHTWTITDGGEAASYKIQVKTDNTGPSTDSQFTLPATGTYDINWGDGTVESVTGAQTHTYGSSGTYVIKVIGGLTAVTFNNGGDKLKLLQIQSWGPINWASMTNAYQGCANMTGTFTDDPVLGGITSTAEMFNGATAFNGDISGWNTSTINNMSFMFRDAADFNQNIGSWDVSSVTNLSFMFLGASSFNGDISGWNVSNVTNMNLLFQDAVAFNRNLSTWNVGNVTTMISMFQGATIFNQPVNSWNVSSVLNMSGMFRATAFNQALNSWNVGNVTNMSYMFRQADAFNQNISSWNVGSVTDMTQMFLLAAAFNQPLNSWNVGNVTNMNAMLQSCTLFDQPLNSWNVGNVTSMNAMLQSSPAFNQDIGGWNVSNVTDFSNFMLGKTPSTFSGTNLDAIYNGWSSRSVSANVAISFGSATYTSAGATARGVLTGAPNNWTITDGGEA